MDPNESLKRIRESCDEIEVDLGEAFDPDSQVGSLIEHFRALDEWLTSCAFLPDDWERKPQNPCGCEHYSHFNEGWPRTGHKYLGVPAGKREAQHVGAICDDCAETHMISFLMFSLDDCKNYATNERGDCGGRVDRYNGEILCENCYNRQRRHELNRRFQDESEKRAEDWSDNE